MAAIAYGDISSEEALVPVAVQTGAYTAARGDLVPCDISGGGFTVKLPNAPANGSRVGVKVINTSPASQYVLTIACQGSDVINKAGGGATVGLVLPNQGLVALYAAGIWYIVTDDLPLSGVKTLIPDWANVVLYGADPTGATDSTAKIQAACNAVHAAGGGTVYYPAGTYVVSSPLLVGGGYPGALQHRGSGWNSQIKLANGANCFIFDFGSGGSPQYTPGCLFADLYLNCNAANQSAASGGIYARGSVFGVFEHLWIDQPYTAGIWFYQDGVGNFGHHNRITGSLFTNGYQSASTGLGVRFDHSDENSVTGCTFQDNGTTVTPAAQVYDTTAGRNSFTGCAFVTTRASAVTMVKTDSSPSACMFTNCSFDAGTTGNLLELNGGSCTVTGCTFLSFGATANDAIHITGTYTVISGCTFTPAGALGLAIQETTGGNHTQVGPSTFTGSYAANGPVQLAGSASYSTWGLLATTGPSGTALTNGTPTILSWTAPNDGQMHRILVLGNLVVSSALTGGQITASNTPPGGAVNSPVLAAAGSGAGTHGLTQVSGVVQAGTTVTVQQGSAVTAGAATLLAEIWGA